MSASVSASMATRTAALSITGPIWGLYIGEAEHADSHFYSVWPPIDDRGGVQ